LGAAFFLSGVPNMKVKRCANCRYFLALANVQKGHCTAPLPINLRGVFVRRKVRDDEGAKCSAYRKRIERSTRKAAKVEQGVQQ
jgi:hypothetical protein